jgi:putative membrane protein
VSEQDKEFLQQSAGGAAFEVTLGRYAAAHGLTPAVRDFGARMDRDHSQEERSISALARQLHVTVHFDPEGYQKAAIRYVEHLHGRAFDDQYAALEESDHESDVMTAKDEIRQGRASAVRTFARSYLTMYEQHLQLAQHVDQATAG